MEKLGVVFGYTAWHPSGRVAVYTTSVVRQFYHAAGDESRDAVDLDGDLASYRFDSREARPLPCAVGGPHLRTFPAWSPDGRFLDHPRAVPLAGEQPYAPAALRRSQVRSDADRL